MRHIHTHMLVADLAGLQLLGLRDFLEIDFQSSEAHDRTRIVPESTVFDEFRTERLAPEADHFFHIPAYDMQMCQRIHGFSLVLGEGDGFPAGKGGKAEFHPMKFRGVACC